MCLRLTDTLVPEPLSAGLLRPDVASEPPQAPTAAFASSTGRTRVESCDTPHAHTHTHSVPGMRHGTTRTAVRLRLGPAAVARRTVHNTHALLPLLNFIYRRVPFSKS